MTAGNSGREEDPRVVYGDIIDLPHWNSPVRPRMSLRERAAQFSPYAALVGYADLVKEEARETGTMKEPGEDEQEEMSRKLQFLAELLAEGFTPECTISWFVPDARKDGGETVTATETIRRIDPVRRRIVLTKKKSIAGGYEEIDLDRVIRIDVEFPEDSRE